MNDRPRRVLVADAIAPEGIRVLEEEGFEVEVRLGLSEEELVRLIPDYDALLVRSGVRVTRPILEAGRRLQVVGRCGVGVENIDVEAATERGILVINSPGGNTIAAAEHTWALMLALARRIPEAVQSLRSHRWERSRFMGIELHGKTLGIIGFGRIGSEVARRARAFQMRVLAYDPWVSPERVRQLGGELTHLETLLREADFVTLHVPLTPETRHLINAERLALMKPTAYLINCARGEVVDEEALAAALREGRLAGAALDVWSQEPPFESPLLALPQVLPTPHLGASTVEAQTKVAVDVAEQVVAVLRGGLPRTPVNLPAVPPEVLYRLQPYMRLAEKLGLLLIRLAPGAVRQVEMHYYGEALREEVQPITRAFLQGLLQPILEVPVNLVNAEHIARQRGIDVIERIHAEESLYTNLVRAFLHTEAGLCSAGGTVVGEGELRIVYLDDYPIYLEPRGYVLLVHNYDQPGAIGRIGTVLGNAGINIANMQVGRLVRGEQAVMVLNLDEPVPMEVLQEVQAGPRIISARLIDFGP